MPTQRAQRSHLVWGLVGLVAVSALMFGTVHPWSRAVLAVGVVGLAGVRLAGAGSAVPRSTLMMGGAGALLVASGALWWLPVSADLRMVLQPGHAGALGLAADALGEGARPLALSPGAALASVPAAATLVAVGWLSASIVRTRGRRLRLVAGLLAVTASVAVLGLVHHLLGLETIYGVSGVPSGPVREAFFAPFVNPNHGGLFCVVGIPLALGVGARRDPAQTSALVMGAALCVAGAVLAGSRGAIVAGVVGVLVFVVVSASRSVAWATAAGALALGGVAAVVGPMHLVERLTRAWLPSAVEPQADSGRSEIWSTTLGMVADAPWVGLGPGGYAAGWRVVETSPRYGDAFHAHNDALQALAEYGVLVGGLWVLFALAPLGLVGLHVRTLRRGRRRRLLAGLSGGYAAVLVAALVSFPVHIGALAVLWVVLGGAVVAAVGQDRRGAAPSADRGGRLALAGLAMGGLLVVFGGNRPELTDDLDLDAQLMQHPLWTRGWLQRADVHVAAGDFDAAEADLAVAHATWPTSPWPHVARAQLLRRKGDLAGARRAWREALAYNFPDNDRGRPWLEAAIADEADPLMALGAVVPERPDRLRDAGFVARSRGDVLLATLFFQRAYDLDPMYGLPLVRQQLEDGLPRQARSDFDGLPAAAAVSCGGRVLDSELALALGDADGALGAARAATRTCGSDHEAAWVVLLRARLATGDAGALEPMERVLAEHPGRHDLRRALLRTLRAAGDHEEMVAHLDFLIAVGVATAWERDDRERIGRGLPPVPR